MFGLGAPELIIILVVALIIFGPKKLPELGKSLGQGIREFRRGTSGLKEELESSFRDEPVSTQAVSTQAVSTKPNATTVLAPEAAPEVAAPEVKEPEAQQRTQA